MKILSVVVALLLSGCGSPSPEPDSEEKFIGSIIRSSISALRRPKNAVSESIDAIANSKNHSDIYELLLDLRDGVHRVQKSYGNEYINGLDSVKEKGIDKFKLLEKIEENYHAWARETAEGLDHALAVNKVYVDEKAFKQATKTAELAGKEPPIDNIQDGGFLGPNKLSEIHEYVATIKTRLEKGLRRIEKTNQILSTTRAG